MPYTVNNKEVREGDKIDYVDHGGNTHKAIMREVTAHGVSHYAEIEHNGQIFNAVPYSAFGERHTWNHTEQPVEELDQMAEPEKEADSGSAKGKSQREGATSLAQESTKAKESKSAT